MGGFFSGADSSASTRLMSGLVVVLVLAAYMVVVPAINTGVISFGHLLDSSGQDWATYSADASAFGNIWGVVAAHLGLASMVLVVWGFYRFFHNRRLEWLWSVSPGVRWRYAIICLAASAIVMGAVTAYHWVTGPGWAPMPGWGWYALVIVATTPFQALAEEVLFRGYMMQALGTMVRNPWFPIVVTAVVFALFHGVQNPWLFSSRLVFGVLAGILVWRTGGLEAAVAIHVVNNLCAFGLAILTGTLSQVRVTTSVGWAQSVSDVVMFAVCALACWGVARGLRVPMRAPEQTR